LLIALVDESRPSSTHVRYLGDSDRPEDGMKSTVTQAMCVENPQSVLCLCTRLDDLANMFRCRQSVSDCNTRYLECCDMLYVRHWWRWRDKALSSAISEDNFPCLVLSC